MPVLAALSTASAIEAALAQLDVEDFSVLPPVYGPKHHALGYYVGRPVLQRQRAVMSIEELDESEPRSKNSRGYRAYRRVASTDVQSQRASLRLFRLRCVPGHRQGAGRNQQPATAAATAPSCSTQDDAKPAAAILIGQRSHRR